MKLESGKPLGIQHNVTIRVLDPQTRKVVQEHRGHNMATNSMLLGIAHYLIGDGVLNQGSYMLSNYVPRYISLGTMGLLSQGSDSEGLPSGLGTRYVSPEEYAKIDEELVTQYEQALAAQEAAKQTLLDALYAAYISGDVSDATLHVYCFPPGYDFNSELDDGTLVWSIDNDPCSADCESCSCPCGQSEEIRNVRVARKAYREATEAVENFDEQIRLSDYMIQRPGYGADGYDANENNHRQWFGLGNTFDNRPDELGQTINCELISETFPRLDISFRDVVPEVESELPMTLDVVFSAMMSTGALKQFREEGRNYLYITECGLWSKKEWDGSGENGLLAGYRIAPPNEWNWYMLGVSVRRLIIEQKDPYAISSFKTYLHSVEMLDDDAITAILEDEESIKSYCEKFAKYNRCILKSNIIKVGVNQIVQVVWKIQIGSIDQFARIEELRSKYYKF